MFVALTLFCTPALAGDDALVVYKSLSPEVALEAAQAALKKCRDNGFQVAVAVVDRFGQPQVMLRDRYAGLPAADIATAKAYTALSFRRSTADLAKMVRDGQMDANLARMPRIAMLAGGLVIETGGTRYVRFEGVEIAAAPNLYVYLSDRRDGATGNYVDLGPLKATRGSFNQEITAPVDLAKVGSVVLWCRAFNVTVTYAPLETTQG